MISARQLANRRETITRNLKEAFPSSIQFLMDTAHTVIPCARWSVTSGTILDGLAGRLQTYDVAFRVETALIPAGIVIDEGKTVIIEDGRRFRVDRKLQVKGDPAIVLECKAL